MHVSHLQLSIERSNQIASGLDWLVMADLNRFFAGVLLWFILVLRVLFFKAIVINFGFGF